MRHDFTATGWLMGAAALAMIVAAGDATAQRLPCAPTDKVHTKLTLPPISEAPFWRGSSGNARIVELWVSETGSWTIMITTANGGSCFMAIGQDWWSYDPVYGEKG